MPDEDRWNKPGYELDRDDILEWGQDGLQDDSLFDNYFSNPKIPIEERWDTLESFAKSADLATLEERTWSGGEETGADLLEWALLRAKKDARLRGHMQSFLHEREDIPDYRFSTVGKQYTFGATKYEWLKKNAPTYNWHTPKWAQKGGSNPEPWHFEYKL